MDFDALLTQSCGVSLHRSNRTRFVNVTESGSAQSLKVRRKVYKTAETMMRRFALASPVNLTVKAAGTVLNKAFEGRDFHSCSLSPHLPTPTQHVERPIYRRASAQFTATSRFLRAHAATQSIRRRDVQRSGFVRSARLTSTPSIRPVAESRRGQPLPT
jgi:cell division inhibitor SulA